MNQAGAKLRAGVTTAQAAAARGESLRTVQRYIDAGAHLLNVHLLRTKKATIADEITPPQVQATAQSPLAPLQQPAAAPRRPQQFPPRSNWTTSWR